MTFKQRPERNERGVCSHRSTDGFDARGLSGASGISAGAAEPPQAGKKRNANSEDKRLMR